MALPSEIQKFTNEPSGTYLIELDRSRTPQLAANTIRLVIGFSKSGPFNTPVFVPDASFFRKVFGDIDRSLERKGSYFHRTALECLNRGPIVVLNLLKLDDQDTTEFISLSAATDSRNDGPHTAPVSGYYNREKFWFIDDDETLRNIDANKSGDHSLVNIANVGRKPITTFIRKADVQGFDITASDWFGSSEVPDFLHPEDWMSDYMIDVIIVDGDFSNTTQLSKDPTFGDYFNADGIKNTYTDRFGTQRDGLEAFLSLDEVNVKSTITGSLIPDFVDKQGNPLFIETLVNIETTQTGLYMAIDDDMYDNNYISGNLIDIVGHSIESEDVSTFNFLSYFGDIRGDREYDRVSLGTFSSGKETFGTTGATSGTGPDAYLTTSNTLEGATGFTSGDHYDIMTVYSPVHPDVVGGTVSSPFSSADEFTTFRDLLDDNSTYVEVDTVGTTGYDFAKAKNVEKLDELLRIQIELIDSEGELDGDEYFAYIPAGSSQVVYPMIDFMEERESNNDSSNSHILYAAEYSDLYQDWKDNIINRGDQGAVGVDGDIYKPIDFVEWSIYDFNNDDRIGTYISGNKLTHPINYVEVIPYDDTGYSSRHERGFPEGATGDPQTIRTLNGSISATFPVDTTPETNKITIDNSSGNYNSEIEKGQFLVSTLSDSNSGKSRLTRIKNVSEDENGIITVETVGDILIRGGTVERYKQLDSYVSSYKPLSLKGYSIKDKHLPNGSTTRMNEIFDVMYNTNIKRGLVDPEAIDFRYIVDTFNNGIEPSSKSRLSKIAFDRDFAFAILNAPSIKEFKNSIDPLFKFDSASRFDTRYISSGGNQRLNPQNTYTLPGIKEGANYCAFYGPNLIVREGNKNISIPPAGHVSNLYIDKHNNAFPFSIVAGPRRGVVSGQGLIGVEYEFDKTDLKNIEQEFGINGIVPKSGVGLVINENLTAQQTVQSALSSAHVRELMIYIERTIDDILASYRWEFNTADNRLRIKTQVDNFLNDILSDNGIYDYQTIMNRSNNTDEVIDAGIGILDYGVEPVRGLGKLIQRVRIFNTGEIERQGLQIEE